MVRDFLLSNFTEAGQNSIVEVGLLKCSDIAFLVSEIRISTICPCLTYSISSREVKLK